ncbi:mannosyl-oligosaccharide 1,2-alpha-mannosidase [Malassezia sp. CBS 17886]|nr:mannosyl-oligosaccharide 1,2-alpha-mannosidase [Malassezia sp. CBS 17886]
MRWALVAGVAAGVVGAVAVWWAGWAPPVGGAWLGGRPTREPRAAAPRAPVAPSAAPMDPPAFPPRPRMPKVPFRLPSVHRLPETAEDAADEARRSAVLEAFVQSWDAYRDHAWGYDEYHPLSKTGSNLLGRADMPLGYTIIDALDALILMGRREEYTRARDWVAHVDWDMDGRLNVFETTIRVLGGLLSASALIAAPPDGGVPASPADARMFLDKAEQLAVRLMPAFASPTGIPLREVNLRTGEAFYDTDNKNASSLAEATTVQLELKYLAHLTGNATYWTAAERPMQHAWSSSRPPNTGVLPIFLNVQNGHFYLTDIRLGSRGDSYYEYLVKQFLQTNRTETIYLDMYQHALDGIKERLLAAGTRTAPPLVYTQELRPAMPYGKTGWVALRKQDHLVCFLGGTFLLGAAFNTTGALAPPRSAHGAARATIEDWRVGHELIRTCVDTYTASKTGLGAEIVFFRPPHDTGADAREWTVKRNSPAGRARGEPPKIDSRNILRPETVESLFIAFQLTGDPLYREWGWQIFEAFRRWCSVRGGRDGFAGIDDVDADGPLQIDRMETFWLSETLKYLYLLFSPRDLLPFDK